MILLLIVLISIIIFSLRLSLSGAELLYRISDEDISRNKDGKSVLNTLVAVGLATGNTGLRLLLSALRAIRALLMVTSVAYFALYIMIFSLFTLGAAGAYSLFFEDLASYTEVGNGSNTSEESSSGGYGEVDLSVVKNTQQRELLKELMESWGSDVSQERVNFIMKGASRIGRSSYSQTDYRRGGSAEDQSVFDCSSFVGWTFNKSIDKTIPTWTTTASYVSGDVGAKFRRISADELIPGDILLNNDSLAGGNANHIGIYVGKTKKGQNMYLHCSSKGIGGAQITTHTWGVRLRYKKFDK